LPKVLIISINQDKAAIQLAKKLRKEDISCIIQSTKISKAMEYANSNQIPFVIFIGEEEIKFKKFKLRNMQTGEEKSLNESQLEKALSK
jgi:histidyl-tRNA synthetase